MPRPQESRANPENLRPIDTLSTNDWRIINITRRQGNITKGQLVDETGIAWATISDRIDHLKADGFIQKSKVEQASRGKRQRGKPSEHYQVNPDAGYVLGVQVELDSVSVRLLDFRFRTVPDFNQSVELNGIDASSVLRILPSLTSDQLAKLQATGKINKLIGIGFSLPGKDGAHISRTVLSYINPQEFFRFEDLTTLRSAGIPVITDQSTRCAAYAEKELGNDDNPRTQQHIVVFHTGSRVGKGIIAEGTLLDGKSGLAGGPEHYLPTQENEICACGQNDCNMLKLTDSYLLTQGRRATNSKSASLDDIAEQARKQDQTALNFFRETGTQLGKAFTIDIKLLNPEMIILHGSLTPFYDLLFPDILQVTHTESARYSLPVTILPSQLKEDANAIGAAINAYHRIAC